MRFLHLGDLHIGKSLRDFDLLEDQEYILNEIINIAKERKVDGILIAGDIYDKSIPSEGAVACFDRFVNNMAINKIKAFIIAGNHDSDERLNFGSSLFESNGIFISAKYNGKLYKRTFEDEHGKLNIFLMPYVKHSMVRHQHEDADIKNYDDAVRTVIAHADIDDSERNIIVAHQYVSGKSKDPDVSGSEGLTVKNVGTIDKVGVDCFDKFDYVALGHIHSPQGLDRETVRYAGSPLVYSLSEIGKEKTIPLITVNEKGNVEVELIPLKPLKAVRQIKGLEKDLLHNHIDPNPNDYLYVTLTDEEMTANIADKVRVIYPFYVKIDYDNTFTKQSKEEETIEEVEDMTFEEMISSFYNQIYKTEITEEEMALMREVGKEVGVLSETD